MAVVAGGAALVVAASSAPTLSAQDLNGTIACRSEGGTPRGRARSKRLWDGYEVAVGPARNLRGSENPCTAAIYDRAGRVVFRTSGFNVVFDEHHSGLDFDGDGKPDVVFITDSGGGMHCCWSYNVVSLSPRPRRLFDIDAPGEVRFEKDSAGRIIIWQRNTGPHGFTSNANVPAAEKVFRVRQAALVDATPEFCPRIFSVENEDYRIWSRHLTAADIQRLHAAGPRAPENEDTVSSLLSRALQHAFCGQFDAAAGDLDLWPDPSRAQMKTEFAQVIRAEYPEFAARLLGTAPRP
jgi:hypothetical protein